MIEVDKMTLILGALFAVSEALSLISSVKSNGVFQLINSVLRAVIRK